MFGRCDECGYEFFQSNLHKFGDKKICILCVPDWYVPCVECGEVINIKETLYDKCRGCNIKIASHILQHYKDLDGECYE